MKSFALLIPTIAAMLIAAGAGTTAQDDAPKPSVTVTGTCVYLDKGRENITVSLTKVEEPTPEGQEPEKEKEPPKPQTAKTNKDGVYEFKSVPIGKYKLTAKGSPQGSIRAYKESAPVDLEITADSKSPVEQEITLTLDRAR